MRQVTWSERIKAWLPPANKTSIFAVIHGFEFLNQGETASSLFQIQYQGKKSKTNYKSRRFIGSQTYVAEKKRVDSG